MHSFEVKELCAALLKEATRQSHEKAEHVMMPLIQGAKDPDSYAHLLQLLFGFYHPLENAIGAFAQHLHLPSDFKKSHRLLRDLEQLGHGRPERMCTQLPVINNDMDALGALYVLEGAALGGRVIARMLQAHQTLPATAFSFFDGNGKETGSRWIQFTQFLNSKATTPVQIEQVCAAATDTFERHAQWMQTQ